MTTFAIFRLTLIFYLYATSLVHAFPLFNKKKVVTRVHTASTTNLVTDYYSTTTEIVVAPTVEFIISGDATFTTTLFPEGVNPTAIPSTMTTVLQNKNVNGNTPLPLSTSETARASSTITLAPVSSSSSSESETVASTSEISTNTFVAQTSVTSTPPSKTYSNLVSALNEQELHAHSAPASPFINTQIRVTTTLSPVSSPNVDENQGQTTAPIDVSQGNGFIASSTSIQTESVTPSTDSNSVSTSTEANSNTNAAITSVPKVITYTPYNDDASCRTAQQVTEDLNLIKSKGISMIRVYGTDCGTFENIAPTAAQLGIKINQGLWISAAGVSSIDEPLNQLIAYGQQNGWDVFEYVTVGNEAINSGYCSVQDLISKIAEVKSRLQSVGYNGQITTSEPPVSFTNHPELCTESQIDFVGINPHAYFDIYASAESAGTFVKGQVALTQQSCGSKSVVVTETGYPSSGAQNGGNIPTQANQILAVQNILNEMDTEVTILSCFNDFWKNPGPYGIEQYFGVIHLLP